MLATHEKSVSINAVWGTGEERYKVFAVNNSQGIDFRGKNNFDLINLIFQRSVEDMNIKLIADFHIGEVIKKCFARITRMGRNYGMCACTADRQGSILKMSGTFGKDLFACAVINRQINIDFRHINIADKTVIINIESFLIICADFLKSLFVERVGNYHII